MSTQTNFHQLLIAYSLIDIFFLKIHYYALKFKTDPKATPSHISVQTVASVSILLLN